MKYKVLYSTIAFSCLLCSCTHTPTLSEARTYAIGFEDRFSFQFDPHGSDTSTYEIKIKFSTEEFHDPYYTATYDLFLVGTSDRAHVASLNKTDASAITGSYQTFFNGDPDYWALAYDLYYDGDHIAKGITMSEAFHYGCNGECGH